MAAERRPYIDWARGVAVLLMIEAHTVDAWTRAVDRNTTAFQWLTILGGMAAPLFLWLAGVGLAFSAGRIGDRSSARTAAVEPLARRGVQIFALAFLFRLQAFVVSPGGDPLMLFRVDILNVMGPSMVAAAVLWPVARRAGTRAAFYGAAAAAIALATPIVRASPLVDRVPLWLQWYLRPAGEWTTFTLLPWSGFLFAGVASGALLAAIRDRAAERRLHAAFAGAAVLLLAAASYASTRPSIYAVPSSFWTSSPTWFAIRVAIVMLAFSALAAIPVRREGALGRFGRASLFIYWIHVELVYGYASWLWRHRLPWWGSVAGFAAFASLMFAVVVARDWYGARRAVRFPGRADALQA